MRSGLTHLLDSIHAPHPPEGGFRYHVKPIPGFEPHYFGRTSEGAPYLLLISRTPVADVAALISQHKQARALLPAKP